MIRDKRLDTIGCIDLLAGEYKTGLRDAVKAALAAKKADAGEGEFYNGVLTQPGEAITIDVERFFAHLGISLTFNSAEFKRAEVLGCLKAGVTETRRLLGEKRLAKISKSEETARKLVVCQKKDLIITPREAAAAIVAAVCGKS